ncbi:MAG: hypothetical protein U0169_10385 [Polyangiaceae bacterium]
MTARDLPGIVWCLAFDADDELADPRTDPTGGSLRARARDLVGIVRRLGLVLPDHAVLDEGGPTPDGTYRGVRGLAFCPTPRSLARLARAGAVADPAPDVDVLRRVNDRAFAFGLGLGLAEAAWIDGIGAFDAWTRDASFPEDCLLKRRFAYAGRGQRRLRRSSVTDADRDFVRKTLDVQGGLLVEPRVAISREFALHGHVDRGARVTWGSPCVQECDARGVWTDTRRAGDSLDGDDERSLRAAGERVATELVATGYHGPFGIDAYRGTVGDSSRFVAVSEVNARYTMGWGVGMGSARPDLRA